MALSEDHKKMLEGITFMLQETPGFRCWHVWRRNTRSG